MIVFFGSSDFSISALKACLSSPWPVSLVITTPDRPKGRGLKLQPTPIKIFCEKNHIPCLAPEKLKEENLISQVTQLSPDFFVVSSYGKIIPSSWLQIPKKLALNVHPSLLPKYRGAAPINWPILNGDPETGMSIAEVTAELDAGDIFYQKRISLTQEINSDALSTQLAELSMEALAQVFNQIRTETLTRQPQDSTVSTYARKLSREDGMIDWNKPACELSRLVRGLLPWPGAFFQFRGEYVQVLKARNTQSSLPAFAPGQVTSIEKNSTLSIQTGEGLLAIEVLKPAGKKEMTGSEFARGRRFEPGMSIIQP